MERRGVVGLAPGEEYCDCSKQFGKWARILWLTGPPRIRFNEYVDSGNQGKDVEDVDVVVTLSERSMAACGASPRAATAPEDASHTSRAVLRPGTAAVAKRSAGLDCVAVSHLGFVVMPGSASFNHLKLRERKHHVLGWFRRCCRFLRVQVVGPKKEPHNRH